LAEPALVKAATLITLIFGVRSAFGEQSRDYGLAG